MSARRGSLLALLAGLWAGVRGPDRQTREFYAAYRLAEGGLPADFAEDVERLEGVVAGGSVVRL